MKVSLKDIAKELNVSVAAVSRALNDLPGISDALRQRAKESAARMGYTRHLRRPAGDAHRRNMKFIVVLYGPVGGPLVSELQWGIDGQIRTRGYYELRYMIDPYHELNSEAGKEAFLMRIAGESGVVGILSCYFPLSDVIIEKLYRLNVPVVQIEHFTEFGRCVTINNVKASQRAVAKLIEMGRKQIGCVTPPEANDRIWADRMAGYRRALKEKGLAYDPSLITYEPWVSIKGGAMATRALLERNPGIDAILYASDNMACGGMKMLRDLGRKVPDDVAVIGFDDEDYDTVLQPSLSSVRQPIRKMAEVGAVLLLDSIDKGDLTHRHVELDTELVVRGSCLRERDEESWA